jgi:hypothetical protein
MFKPVIFTLCIIAFPSLASAACEVTKDSFIGTLTEVTAEHPNGTTFTAFMLEADDDVIVPSIDGNTCTFAARIQIDPADQETETAMRARLGEVVTITSPDMFEAHTAWHIGDAVAMQARLVMPLR